MSGHTRRAAAPKVRDAQDPSQPLAPPVDLSHHFSTATGRREGSLVKDFYKYFTIPGIQNLAGGR